VPWGMPPPPGEGDQEKKQEPIYET
jgi:hypothetical protein